LRDFSFLVHGVHRGTLLACPITGECELDNPEKIIRLQAVKARCGLSRSTLYNRMAAGEFPSPVALGARAVGWVESEVNAWIADRINASRKGGTNPKSQAA
jgi:prophage regulatory protein